VVNSALNRNVPGFESLVISGSLQRHVVSVAGAGKFETMERPTPDDDKKKAPEIIVIPGA
jgi:hypothetical protein